ncbi:hypothetical protein SAMN05216420_10119 [Nitrosospira sp. Nl5]|uniref:hypothetical protein n=1 Tax=Nitrosospira sp. Nl5 TaxID=200120 RepID=UPI00088BF234|nr:hypothetical protein [Nitrosospira sp. Nl5]SCX82675.1 hypothetical protein SAMN05216420_10119 [Nitrosospira sp. Nl5]
MILFDNNQSEFEFGKTSPLPSARFLFHYSSTPYWQTNDSSAGNSRAQRLYSESIRAKEVVTAHDILDACFATESMLRKPRRKRMKLVPPSLLSLWHKNTGFCSHNTTGQAFLLSDDGICPFSPYFLACMDDQKCFLQLTLFIFHPVHRLMISGPESFSTPYREGGMQPDTRENKPRRISPGATGNRSRRSHFKKIEISIKVRGFFQ